MTSLLAIIKITASVFVFLFATSKISSRQWKFNQLEMWAYVLCIAGSVSTIATIVLSSKFVLIPADLPTDIGLAIFFYLQVHTTSKDNKIKGIHDKKRQ